jgi:hypothetical protein
MVYVGWLNVYPFNLRFVVEEEEKLWTRLS